MSVAYPRMNVKLVGMMPGLSSPGGASHQAIDDLAIMRATHNMTVLDVGEAAEAENAVRILAELPGPMFLRLKRGELPVLFDKNKYQLEIGQSYLLKEGNEVGIVTSGLMTEKALRAAYLIEQAGFRVSVLHVPSIKPIDSAGICQFAIGHRVIFTLDNHNVIGGLGSAVIEALTDLDIHTTVIRLGVRDVYAQAASSAFLYRKHGLEPDQIAETILVRLTGRAGSLTDIEQTMEEAKSWGGSF